ncbi:MAG: hypothetical protein IPK04_11535 [Bdellovibrionales bacterium]|nr:hypothetical protein [Bdellovibrionales bacterium]
MIFRDRSFSNLDQASNRDWCSGASANRRKRIDAVVVDPNLTHKVEIPPPDEIEPAGA